MCDFPLFFRPYCLLFFDVYFGRCVWGKVRSLECDWSSWYWPLIPFVFFRPVGGSSRCGHAASGSSCCHLSCLHSTRTSLHKEGQDSQGSRMMSSFCSGSIGLSSFSWRSSRLLLQYLHSPSFLESHSSICCFSGGCAWLLVLLRPWVHCRRLK